MIVRREGGNPFFGVLIVLFLFLMIWLAISAVKGIFVILSWLAFPLFFLALILNHNVVIDYIAWLWKLLTTDLVRGVIYTGLSLLAYPFVSAYLAFKAFSNHRWKKEDEGKRGEYIRYKEVDVVVEEEDDDFLELEDFETIKKGRSKENESNNYDDMFE